MVVEQGGAAGGIRGSREGGPGDGTEGGIGDESEALVQDPRCDRGQQAAPELGASGGVATMCAGEAVEEVEERLVVTEGDEVEGALRDEPQAHVSGIAGPRLNEDSARTERRLNRFQTGESDSDGADRPGFLHLPSPAIVPRLGGFPMAAKPGGGENGGSVHLHQGDRSAQFGRELVPQGDRLLEMADGGGVLAQVAFGITERGQDPGERRAVARATVRGREFGGGSTHFRPALFPKSELDLPVEGGEDRARIAAQASFTKGIGGVLPGLNQVGVDRPAHQGGERGGGLPVEPEFLEAPEFFAQIADRVFTAGGVGQRTVGDGLAAPIAEFGPEGEVAFEVGPAGAVLAYVATVVHPELLRPGGACPVGSLSEEAPGFLEGGIGEGEVALASEQTARGGLCLGGVEGIGSGGEPRGGGLPELQGAKLALARALGEQVGFPGEGQGLDSLAVLNGGGGGGGHPAQVVAARLGVVVAARHGDTMAARRPGDDVDSFTPDTGEIGDGEALAVGALDFEIDVEIALHGFEPGVGARGELERVLVTLTSADPGGANNSGLEVTRVPRVPGPSQRKQGE